MASTVNTNAVFFLGPRTHYQVLDQPEAFDPESGNTSTETLYQNTSVEELWSNDVQDCDSLKGDDLSAWFYEPDINVNFENNTGIKKRFNRQSNEALLSDNTILDGVLDSDVAKVKPRRTFLSFLSSLARRGRKRRVDTVKYLQHMESVLTTCTYRGSCRCLDCQSRYFDYESDTEDENTDEDYAYQYTLEEAEPQIMVDEELDDEVFVSYNPDDNISSDLLIDADTETITSVSSGSESEPPVEKQAELDVAASTSAILNVVLFHPACIVQ